MELFITAEYSDGIETEYAEVKHDLIKIEQEVATKDYGTALTTLLIVHILLSPEHLERTQFGEVVHYYPQKKMADVRLVVDYDTFRKASKQIRLMLLVDNITKAVKAIAQKIPNGFDADRLERDLQALYKGL